MNDSSGPPSVPPPRSASIPPVPNPAESADPARARFAKAGMLLADLADHATRLASLLAEQPPAKTLAGNLCRRAETARKLGHKLALCSAPSAVSTTALLNDAILALDGVSLDVEHAAELAAEVKIKNQIARARLAVTTSACAIEDIRRAS